METAVLSSLAPASVDVGELEALGLHLEKSVADGVLSLRDELHHSVDTIRGELLSAASRTDVYLQLLQKQAADLKLHVKEVPSLTMLNTKVESLRGLFRCHTAKLTESHDTLTLQVRSRFDGLISKLGHDCRRLIDSNMAETEEYMARVKDQILYRSAAELCALVPQAIEQVWSSVVEDVVRLKKVALELRPLQSDFKRVQDDMSQLTDTVSEHSVAFRSLIGLVHDLQNGLTPKVATAVATAVQQLLDSDVIRLAVRRELADRPAPPGSARLLAADIPDEPCVVCGGLRSVDQCRSTCECLSDDGVWER